MTVFNIFSNRQRVSTLCETCVYVHVIEGADGNRLTSCAYGYALRSISFEVTDCSSYTVRSARTVTVVNGFIVPSTERAS
jgi:hypothetical protein